MRKILFFLIFLIGISINVNAETETRVFMEDRTLIVEEIEIEIKERKEVPGVPTGIDAETAHQLVSGELDKKELDKKDVEEEEKSFLFGFPIIKQVKTLSKVVTYNNGWKETDGAPSIKNTKDYAATFVGLILPTICILVVSFINQFGHKHKRLRVFYVAIIFSLFVGTFGGMLVGIFVGGVAGVFAGAFTVLPKRQINEVASVASLGIFAGGVAGMSAGTFAGVLVEVWGYGMFVLTVEIVSFAIVYIAQKIKLRPSKLTMAV